MGSDRSAHRAFGRRLLERHGGGSGIEHRQFNRHGAGLGTNAVAGPFGDGYPDS